MNKIYNQYKTQILNDRVIFNDDFNEPLDKCINLLGLKKIIVFGKSFNQDLESIPMNVQQIYLGKYFQKSLTNIPSNVKSICFANDSLFYNYLDYLHDDVEELILGDDYNVSINKLPLGLKILILGTGYNFKINAFPNLMYLDIGESYSYSLDNLPLSLETLVVGGEFNNYIKFPEQLKHFVIKKNCMFGKELDNLPNSLVFLSIQNNYTLPLTKLPDSITCISLGDHYNGNISNFSSKLLKVILSDGFEWDLSKFPKTIEVFEISKKFKHIDSIVQMFPNIKINLR